MKKIISKEIFVGSQQIKYEPLKVKNSNDLISLWDDDQTISFNFTKTAKKAYKKSISPKVLKDLKLNFKGLSHVIDKLESISHLLFFKSLFQKHLLSDFSLHMAFTGKAGTGKTSLALKIAQILRDLNYLTKGHLILASRDDLVGEYVGHTAPKTRQILQKSEGGILFIDEASELYKLNNEKDYGSEAIEIILQIMENQRKDLVLIFSDEKSKLDNFFEINPGVSSRIAHHIHFSDYSVDDLKNIFLLLLKKEGQFFLNNQEQNLLFFNLYHLRKLSTYANVRSLEMLNHKLLSYQAERLYNKILIE
jgi:SpoVK/Ycf46/Vps4 family AAA+-type ATPase